MNNAINTAPAQSPKVYNFYFAEELNVSRERKDSRSSSSASQHCKKTTQIKENDRILQKDQTQQSHVEQSLLEEIEENQFMTPFTSERKNTGCSVFKTTSVLCAESPNSSCVTTSIAKMQIQNENEAYFLLDSDTYKQICFQQDEKKVQIISNFDMKTRGNLQNLCQIHQKPYEIVCIEDKVLMCSHCAIFGQHKTHSLAPLKQIQKCIQQKKIEIDQIIINFKFFQLALKQKSFASQYTEQIHSKKHETKLKINEHFKQVREYLNKYESDIEAQLQTFYQTLELKMCASIRQTTDYSNTVTFDNWQKDALHLTKQISLQQISNEKKINLFLTHFELPQFFSCDSMKVTEPFISAEIQGNTYLNEIKESLNLNIDKLMNIMEKFTVQFDQQYSKRIRQFVNFQCDVNLHGIFQENTLPIIQDRLTNNEAIDNFLQSFQTFKKTTKSIKFKLHEADFVSTGMSMSQTIPMSRVQSSKKINSPTKKLQGNRIQTENTQINPTTMKKSFKYNRRQTLEDLKKLQQNIRHQKSPLNILEAKSTGNEKNNFKRQISPCLKNMVYVQKQNQGQFNSTMTSRVNRYRSRDAASHNRSPSDMKNKVQTKDFKNKKQADNQAPQPLKILQNFTKAETQTFDISNCKLDDTEIIYFVQRASKVRKIKNLKLSSNNLTSSGLQKVLPYLSYCNLLNLSNNKLSEMTIDILLQKKQRIPHLKILNLSNNKLNERKIRQKIMEFKKAGVVITL